MLIDFGGEEFIQKLFIYILNIIHYHLVQLLCSNVLKNIFINITYLLFQHSLAYHLMFFYYCVKIKLYMRIFFFFFGNLR